jgi:hypothetical protein
MLRDLDSAVKEYQEALRKSREKYEDKLESIQKLIFDVNRHFWTSYNKCCRLDEPDKLKKFFDSLINNCYLESWRISPQILYFCSHGFYRNAFESIRYVLESAVQALYIDIRHPESDFDTKIEILKEIEDKTEYHTTRLIDKLEISHKDLLKQEYKRLSQIIHPSHRQHLAQMENSWMKSPVVIDSEEILKICSTMQMMYDILLFLYIKYFPEIGIALQANADFGEDIRNYNLTLLSAILHAGK